jgi:hypothetical protein
MKSIIKYTCLFTLVLFVLTLSACTGAVSTIPQVTTPLPTVAPPNTQPFTMPDQGIIEINGQNFSYQRVYDTLSGFNLYRGVVFSPKDRGTVIYTGVSGYYTVTFADGTAEDLLFAGTLMYQTDYRLTKHNNPRAGVMEAYGDNHWILYVLVSE